MKIVRDGLVKHTAYLDLIGQVGSTPHEYYEDMVREEKEQLKLHKSDFKQLLKSNGIRLGSSVTFDRFETTLTAYQWY